MNKEVWFYEKQRFTQWWLWTILVFINLIFFCLVIYNYKSPSFVGLLLGAGINFFITILFYSFRLQTEIGNDGISVKFFPFHLHYIHFSWDKINEAYLRKYHPLTEYGGWGLRYNLSGGGKAYNVSGDKGIQLVLKGGSKILIGTNKPEEVEQILKKRNGVA